jgi:hypothetical protein
LEIEPANYWLVAQCLKQLRHRTELADTQRSPIRTERYQIPASTTTVKLFIHEFSFSDIRSRCTAAYTTNRYTEMLKRSIKISQFDTILNWIKQILLLEPCISLIYAWKPTNASIIIQFISYVWWLLHVSALYCHPQGAFPEPSERWSIEVQSIKYYRWVCCVWWRGACWSSRLRCPLGSIMKCTVQEAKS